MHVLKDKSQSYIAHIVSHTHWDREWYQPFEQMRARLVEVIDELLYTLDSKDNFRVFMLDGQTIVLEDYLEIRPENESKLRKHISDGQILVGPWYVLSDEFLSSGEASIRNLLIGHDISARFGDVMKVGYVPDTFGHISQLPQVLRGFGMDSAVLFRGVGNRLEDTEGKWYSPDGSNVILLNMKNTYGHMANVDPRPEFAAERIKSEISALAPYGNTPYVLLMNGVDHQFAQADIGDIIEAAKSHLDRTRLVHSTLTQFLEKVRSYEDRFKRIDGELRLKGAQPCLPGVLSTRMYLKQLNYACQIDLEKYVEPLSAFSWMMGGKYDRAFVTKCWKYILSNQPHDSICGCSVDDVHREMETRYRKAKNLSEWLIRQSAYGVASRIDTQGNPDHTPMITFNTGSPRPAEATRVTFWTRDMDNDHYDVIDSQGNSIPCQVVSSKVMNWQYVGLFRKIVMEEEDGTAAPFLIVTPEEFERYVDEGKWFLFPVKKVEMDVLLKDMNGCGYSTFWVRPAQDERLAITDLLVSEDSLENQYLKATVDRDGSVSILDKQTGAVFEGCNVFVDDADAGDSYNYSPIPNDKLIYSTECECSRRIIADGPVKGSIEVSIDLPLPECLNADRRTRSGNLVTNSIKTSITLSAGSQRVEFRTTCENRSKDHRLRAYFPTNLLSDSSYGCGQFDVVKREIRLSEEALLQRGELSAIEGEAGVATHPQEYFVDVNDGKVGLAVLTRGLPEYEVLPEGNIIAITLERSVGAISRSDLLTRNGATSPPLEAPEAQCLREFVFDYAVVPHSGDQTSERLLGQMEHYHNPLLVVQSDQHAGDYSHEFSWIGQDDPRIVLSAIKKCEKEDALLVRMFNTTGSGIRATLKVCDAFGRVYETGLGEVTERELPVESGIATADFGPKQIKSFKMARTAP